MTEFPQYRRLKGFDRFYKIVDEKHFVEASVKQGKLFFHEVAAVQYPEMMRILDMLDEAWNYVKMSAEEIARVFPES